MCYLLLHIYCWMLMAVPPLEPYGDGQTDRHCLLIDQPAKVNERELLMDISRGGATSTSHSWI